MPDVFESLKFVNASGNQVLLVDKAIDNQWELGGRYGFTAPDVDLITETYANGVTKILRRIIKPRTCGVNLIAKGKTSSQLDAQFDEMIGLLMDVSKGEVGRLYVTRSDGSVVYLNCTYSGGANVRKDYKRFRKFSVEFYGADPYFYRELDQVFIEVPASARLTLHNGLSLYSGRVLGENTGIGESVIINNGSEIIQPIIRIQHVKGDLMITNITNGDRIRFNNIVVAKNDVLVIDTRDTDKEIYIEHSDGTTSPAGQYLNWENIEFNFGLVSGENHIQFKTGERSTTEGMSFQMFERYLTA